MPRTQEQRKAATRAGLLDAAADQFARHGFHAVSAEAVADAADRTTGALYSHFGNKEGLLFALVDDFADAAATAIVTGVDDRGDLDGILTAAWDRVTAPGEEADRSWLLLEMEIWLHGARDAEIGARLAERYHRIRADLAAGLAAWADSAGRALPAPAERLASLTLSLLLGAALQHRLDPQSMDAATLIDGIHDLIDPEEHA